MHFIVHWHPISSLKFIVSASLFEYYFIDLIDQQYISITSRVAKYSLRFFRLSSHSHTHYKREGLKIGCFLHSWQSICLNAISLPIELIAWKRRSPFEYMRLFSKFLASFLFYETDQLHSFPQFLLSPLYFSFEIYFVIQ